MNKTPSTAPKRLPAVMALCIVLWVITLLLSVYSLWLLTQPGNETFALLALVIAVFTSAAGYGLFKAKRWGVVVFGILALVGSVNHLSGSVQRFSEASQAETELSLLIARMISVLGAFLIPFVLIYFILILWRQMR